MKCTECKWCGGEYEKMYACNAFIDGCEWVEEAIALDDNLGCDLFVQKLDDNKTEESSA